MKNILDVIFKLKPLRDRLYEGSSSGSFNHKQYFGGTLVGQSLSVGYQVVPKEFYIHNIHAYYVRGGIPNVPVNYEVAETVSGKSFQRVFILGKQEDKSIARFSLSFKVPEKSISYTYIPPFTNRTDLNKLFSFQEIIENKCKVSPILKSNAEKFKVWLTDFPFILKPEDPASLPKDNPPEMKYWFKLKPEIDTTKIDIPLKQMLIAFLSDYGAMFPIILKNPFANFGFVTSLDHSLWFHSNDFDVNQYFVIENRCVVAENCLTLNIGSVWSEDRRLIVTVVQQGLLRESSSNTSNMKFS